MDKKEFAARIDNIKNRLYRTAYLYLGNEANALEAVDEAVFKAFKSYKKLRQPEFFETWITRILINECKQAIKRFARVQPSESLLDNESFEHVYDSLPLKDAIKKLPRELREIIILRFFSDYTLTQTAECLEIPQGTVVTRQRRALQLLKLELVEED